MRSIRFTLSLALVATALVASLGAAPTFGQPNPTECVFPIDQPHFDISGFPTVAHRQDGGFLVAYAIFLRTAPPGGEFERGIFLRRFDAAGNYVGGPSTVLPFEPFNVQSIDLERDANGNFILGWSSADLDGPETNVRVQRLDADGTLLGSEILVNDQTAGFHRQLAFATTADRVLYVWFSDALDSDAGGIVGRLADLNGNLLGNAFAINTYTTGQQSQPAIDVTPSGDFVVAWRGEGVGPGSAEGVFLRTFDTAGTPLIPEARVSSSTGLHSNPSVGHDDDHLLVAWAYRPTSGDERSVRGQFVDAAAFRDRSVEALGTEIVIRSSANVDAFFPTVASRSGGEFVVVWDDYDPYLYGGNELGARTVTETGGVGPLFDVASDCLGCIFRPDLEVSPLGDDFVVVWQNSINLNRGQIAGQRFDGPVGALEIDLSLDITEEEDPTDAVTGVDYILNLENPGPCPVTGVQVEVTLPQEVVDVGFSWTDDNNPDCSADGDQLTCTGTLAVGVNDNVHIFSQDLPNFDDQLTTSGSLTSNAMDPNLANNSEVETTQVLRCVQLALEHSGKGSAPVADPVAPCTFDTFAPGTQVQLTATPAPDGWRVGSWSGTDNDASTSRFNTVTVGGFDQDVTVHYELAGGNGAVSWWTADGVLEDILGPNDLMTIGAGDPFNFIGEQGQAFFADGNPILEAPFDPSMNLGDTFSIGMWVRVSGSVATRALLDHREQGATANVGTYTFLSNQRPAMRLGDGQIARNYISPTPIGDDTFHLVIYTFDQGDLRIYIDGVLDSQHDASAIGSRDNTSRLTLGSQSLGATGALFGRLDEVFMTTDVLSQNDIEQLFLRPLGLWRGDGNALDSSTYGSHATLAGGAGFTDGRCRQAFDLSAPGSVVTAPGTPGIEVSTFEFTFAAWLRADDIAPTQQLFQKGVVGLTLEDGQLHLTAGSAEGTATALGDLRDGQSHYVAVTSRRTSGSTMTMTFWVDGQVQQINDGTGGEPDIGGDPMFLGGGQAGPMYLDEVLFLGEVISPERFPAWRQLCLQPFFGDGFEAGDTSAWSAAVP